MDDILTFYVTNPNFNHKKLLDDFKHHRYNSNRYRVRTYHTCSELQCPTAVHWFWFGLVKYRAPVPKLPRHLPLDGGSNPRLHHTTEGASSVRVCHPCLSAVAALAYACTTPLGSITPHPPGSDFAGHATEGASGVRERVKGVRFPSQVWFGLV